MIGLDLSQSTQAVLALGILAAMFGLQNRIIGNLAPQGQPDIQHFAAEHVRGETGVDHRNNPGFAGAGGVDGSHAARIHIGIDRHQKPVFRLKMMGNQPARHPRLFADLINGKLKNTAPGHAGQGRLFQRRPAGFTRQAAVFGGICHRIRPF